MSKIRNAWVAMFLGLPVLTNAGEAAAPVPTVNPKLQGADLFTATCAACHGPQGQGNDELRAPSIAALPAWYVTNQLDHFRAQRRGTDAADAQGLMMAAIAKALSPQQVQGVARHLETLPRAAPKAPPDAKANLAEGRWLYETRCMECHRYNGSGELVFASPPLIGLQGWYLQAQLEKYRQGLRGAAPGDVNGAKMVLATSHIESDAQLRDVVAFILTLNQPPESNPFE